MDSASGECSWLVSCVVMAGQVQEDGFQVINERTDGIHASIQSKH